MAALTIAGIVLTAVGVAALGMSLRCLPESRCRFRWNWWAIILVWFGVVFMLSGELMK